MQMSVHGWPRRESLHTKGRHQTVGFLRICGGGDWRDSGAPACKSVGLEETGGTWVWGRQFCKEDNWDMSLKSDKPTLKGAE